MENESTKKKKLWGKYVLNVAESGVAKNTKYQLASTFAFLSLQPENPNLILLNIFIVVLKKTKRTQIIWGVQRTKTSKGICQRDQE